MCGARYMWKIFEPFSFAVNPKVLQKIKFLKIPCLPH